MRDIFHTVLTIVGVSLPWRKELEIPWSFAVEGVETLSLLAEESWLFLWTFWNLSNSPRLHGSFYLFFMLIFASLYLVYNYLFSWYFIEWCVVSPPFPSVMLKFSPFLEEAHLLSILDSLWWVCSIFFPSTWTEVALCGTVSPRMIVLGSSSIILCTHLLVANNFTILLEIPPKGWVIFALVNFMFSEFMVFFQVQVENWSWRCFEKSFNTFEKYSFVEGVEGWSFCYCWIN